MRPILILMLPLLAMAVPKTVYPFDARRFSQEFSENSADITNAQPDVETNVTRDFVLDRTGAVIPANKPLGLNTDTSGFDQLPTSNRTTNSFRILNKVYSSLETVGTVAKCGPSAFQPTQIEAFVRAAAERHGVDPDLATAIAWTESRFDQARNSPKGARGPMQLMPATAQDLGVRDSCDSVANIDGGVRHLKALIAELGNPLLAVAAYNAGVQAVYDSGGVPPYPETVRYVVSFLNRQLGLQFPAPKRRGKGNIVADQTPSPNGRAGIDQAGINQVSAVLGAKGSRFINGVMHF